MMGEETGASFGTPSEHFGIEVGLNTAPEHCHLDRRARPELVEGPRPEWRDLVGQRFATGFSIVPQQPGKISQAQPSPPRVEVDPCDLP